jgi:hypothetical protein
LKRIDSEPELGEVIMTAQAQKFHVTYFGRPFEGKIETAHLSLRFDYKWSDDLFLDIEINCAEMPYPSDDGEQLMVHPALLIDSLALPLGMPRNGDFRDLENLDFTFEDPDFDLEAPGTVQFFQYHQMDLLKLKLRYLGFARFHIALSGTAEDVPFDVETIADFSGASMLHRGTAAQASDMNIEISQHDRDAASARGDRWVELAEPPTLALSRFARFLRVEDYDFITRVDASDLNVDVIGKPKERTAN